jgi:hypothetical protein
MCYGTPCTYGKSLGKPTIKDVLFSDDQLQDPRLLLSSIEQQLLVKVLSVFSGLSTLILPTVVNTEILETISACMTNLKSLDISCSTNVTDYGILVLAGFTSQCKHLEEIFLEGTSTPLYRNRDVN